MICNRYIISVFFKSILIADRHIQQAVDYFLTLPENNDLAQYKITPNEWVAMQEIEIILSVRHQQAYGMYSKF
jgi:hypothetical protein